MTPEEAIKLVKEAFPFEEYMDRAVDAYLNIAKTALRYLRPGDKVLDFASGPCDKAAIIQILGFNCSAYDDLQDNWHKIEGNKDKILAFAKKFGIKFRYGNNGYLLFEKSSFDMLMLHDILEHLHDSPRDLLNDLLELVKPEGYIFITVPNAVNIRKRICVLFGKTNYPSFELYYWYPGPWRGHVREYTKDELIKISKYLNLQILELRSCHHMLHKLPSVFRPIYHCITSVFTGWKDTWLLVAKKKRDWETRKTLPHSELKNILGGVSQQGCIGDKY